MKDEDPITTDEIVEWLHTLEDIAVNERDLGFATRLVLTNLLKRLATGGLFDSKRLILDLQGGLPHLAIQEHERLGAHVYLEELERQLPELSRRSPGEPPLH